MITALCCLALGILLGYGWRRAESQMDAYWADVDAIVNADRCPDDARAIDGIPSQREGL